MIKLLYYKHATFYMKRNNYLYIFIILILGILLRLYSIDKAEGLWNDEYVSWFIASQDNVKDFFHNMITNCHMPLYYLYIKFWLLLFPDTDVSLRISSVIPSVLSIITMFFIGKEFKNEKLGYTCSFLMAINSFSIYFAQEVRLYSLLILFSSLSCLYFIKTAKNTTNKNINLFLLSNFLICITHTIGILFSFFNIGFLTYYLFKNNEDIETKIKEIILNKKNIIITIIALLLILPFAINIAFSKNLSQFWSDFSITKIFCTFIDYLSPIQTNIINTKQHILDYFMWTDYPNKTFIIYGFLPFLIGFIAIIKALLQKDKIINELSKTICCFFLSLVVFAIIGKIVLITKYSAEIFPILILLMAIGFNSFKFKKIGAILLLSFITLNLNYLYSNSNSAPKKVRAEGNKIVVDILEQAEIKDSDYVLLTYYDKTKFDRYLTTKANIDSIDKLNFHIKLFNNEDYHNLIRNGKETKREFFEKKQDKTIYDFCEKSYKNNLKKGDKIALVFLDSVSFINETQLNEIVKNNEEYKNTSFIFLLFSKIKSELNNYFNKELTFKNTIKKGAWSIYIYEK